MILGFEFFLKQFFFYMHEPILFYISNEYRKCGWMAEFGKIFKLSFCVFWRKWQSEKTTEMFGALNFHSKSRSFVFFFWKLEIGFFFRTWGWLNGQSP